jgi:putative DNA primase/helicase
MRTYTICIGNSRESKFWPSSEVTFDELYKRLKHPLRTSETTAQYKKMSKADRDSAKDKGGFMAGKLKGTRRKKEEVLSRSMITLDGDRLRSDFITWYKENHIYTSILYTTHSHTPEAPRGRILIPATRDMTPEEANAISRYFASWIGISQIDPCSFKINQMMYWPTCPSDGEYICERYDGELLDPDVFLSACPNWEDVTTLPRTPGEDQAIADGLVRQEDPLLKDGIVGDWCRAHSISDVMEHFLTDIYAPTAPENRYDFIAGEGTAGVVVYEDKFAYSHHATDPAGGRLLNAFDLVRLHRFKNDNPKKSFLAMAEFAAKDEAVRAASLKRKQEEAETDFTTSGEDDGSWKKQLKYMSRSTVLQNCVWNEMLILNHDPDFQNFAFNEMANRIQVTGPLPWDRPSDNKFWRDADTAQLKALIDIRYVPFSSRNHDVSFTKVADDRRFHPVRDYLDTLPKWDNTPRLDTLFIRYLQADDTDYVRAVTRKTLAAAVARIYHPGTKFDTVLVLDGIQGIGKSTMWKSLAGDDYFSDALSLTDMDDKSGAEKLQGFWIIEIGELAGMKKADIEKVKSFLSTSDDKYRPSYGKVVESHPRQCIVVATVNGEQGYLRDITGNRRFWIVKCRKTCSQVNWKITSEERDQIWAEAKHYYESGEKLYLEGGLLSDAEEAQRSAMEADERQGLVEKYLDTLLPENWPNMNLYQRRNFLDGDITTDSGKVRRLSVSNAEIWCECFGRSLSELKPSDSYAIAALMTQINGWKRSSRRVTQPIYGRQRIYERV